MRGIGSLAAAALLVCLAACSGRNESARKDDAEVVAAAESQAKPDSAKAHGRRHQGVKPPVPIPEACEIEGIENCRKVGDDLLFGGQPSQDALRALAKQGYKTVVSARGKGELDWDEQALVDSLGMKFVQIPMAYPIETIHDEWVEQLDQVMTGAERPILMHCSSGNRIAGLWAVWLAEKKGVTPEEAMGLGTEAGMTRIEPVVAKRLGRPTE